MSRKELEPLYIAGLIDGEGCIHFRFKQNKLYIIVAIHMSYAPILAMLQLQFGGAFSLEKRKKKDNRKPTWRWQVSNKKAVDFLRLILPFLIVKKKQAELAVEYYELKDKEKTIDFKDKMHELNKRGIA